MNTTAAQRSEALTLLERPRAVLIMAIWFAMATAGGELAVLGVRKFVEHRALFLGPHTLWLTPTANALLFLSVGCLLLLTSLAWRPLRSLRVSTLVFSFLGVLAVLLMFERLHRIALLLLATGIAVNASTLFARRAEGFRRVVWRSTPVLVSFVVVTMIAVSGARLVRERLALARLSNAPAGASNVVLIIWDTVRALSLSAYGYHRPTTPNLEALARRGVLFDVAMATAPWTLPSHASMFTGRYAHELSTDFGKPLDDVHPTVAEVLRHRGYLTAGFVANTLYCGYEFGLNRGFTHYEDYGISAAELVLSSSVGRTLISSQRLRRIAKRYDVVGRKKAEQVTADFLQWLPASGQRPFFAFLNYYDAHEPYLPPSPFRERYGPPTARQLNLLDHRQLRHATRWGKRRMLPAGRQLEQNAYDGAIERLDAELGKLMAELERRGVLDNTIVIVTSDHGEHLGEHNNLFGHGSSLYTQETQVPLVIVAPRKQTPTRVSTAVSLRDLPATMLGLTVGEERGIPGTSLARYWDPSWKATGPQNSPILSQYWERQQEMKSVVVDNYHYIKSKEKEEVFDISRDPREMKELISNSAVASSVLHRLRSAAAPFPARNRPYALD
jgi:arylsulfatase A-like enzyme